MPTPGEPPCPAPPPNPDVGGGVEYLVGGIVVPHSAQNLAVGVTSLPHCGHLRMVVNVISPPFGWYRSIPRTVKRRTHPQYETFLVVAKFHKQTGSPQWERARRK